MHLRLETSSEGSPEAIREYIHVEDAARASVDALKDEFRNQHVILSGHQPLRVLDLLKFLSEILGKEGWAILFKLRSLVTTYGLSMDQPKWV